jgi:transmembrane sensor
MSDLSAREVKAAAAQWFERRNFWAWTAEDESEFASWLDASFAHRAAYVRVEAAWKRAERLTVVKSSLRPQPARVREPSWPRHMRFAGAAAVIAAAIGAAYFWPHSEPESQTYATMVGGRETLALADGTRIDLNTDTRLRTRITAHERKVWLDKGEAYFQVKHDAAHPFVVIAGAHRITDLGTKFVVRETGERVDVSLLEGRARIDAPNARDTAQSAILMPGDVAVATDTSLSVRKRPTRRIENDLAWRTGLLVFNNTTLGEAADAFNRYNRVKLVIENPQTAALTIDGTFHTDNVAAFVDVAQHVLKLNVKTSGDEIVIAP